MRCLLPLLALLSLVASARAVPPGSSAVGGAPTAAGAVPEAFPTTLVPPNDPAFAPMYDRMREQGTPADTGAVMSQLLDLRGAVIPVSVRDCDDGAYYHTGTREIVICWAWLGKANTFNGTPVGTYDVYTATVLEFALLHEMGHALLHHVGRVPAKAGHGEDYADAFAMLFFASVNPELTRKVIAGPLQWFVKHGEWLYANFTPEELAADEHRPSDARARLAGCLVYGVNGDRAILDLVGHTGELCREYADAATRDWNMFLEGHTRLQDDAHFFSFPYPR